MATIAGKVAGFIARVLALAWLAPALFVNVDWTGNTPLGLNLAAAGSILASALFIEASRHAPRIGLRATLLLVGLGLVLINVQVAFDNLSHRSDDQSDHRKSAIIAAQTASSQRSQLSQSRTEAATIAGERSPDGYEADIQSKILGDAKRWQATDQCDPLKTTAGASMAFCSDIGALRAKVAAARKRDEIDTKIADLDRQMASMEVVSSVDPFADNIADFMAMFGLKVSDDMKRALSAQKNALRSIALELVAALGPTAWLLMLAGLAHAPVRVPRPNLEGFMRREKESAPRVKSEPLPVLEQMGKPADVPISMDDPFHSFVAQRLEDFNGVTMPASEPWQIWCKWCTENAVPQGSQRSFGGKMKTRFAHDQNNNRPRYLNVRAKAAAPSLRIVAAN